MQGVAHGADVAAQFMHDVGEFGRVGDLQIARSRQVNVALDDKTPRAAAHDIYGIGQEHRLAQVMRDQDDVELLLGPEVAQDAPELLAREGVERTEGFVEQQHLGFVDERAADAGALLHTARELPGKLVLVAAQPHFLQQGACALLVFLALGLEVAAVGFDDLQRQQHVVHGRAPGQQGGCLKRHARDLERAGDRLAVDQDLPPGRHLQAGGKLHEGGLAAARGSDNGDEFALTHLQVNRLDREMLLLQHLAVVGEPDIPEIDKPVVNGNLHAISLAGR